VAVITEVLGVPPLIFALGMYLPLELNTPALVGGFISHAIIKRSDRSGGAAGRTTRKRGVIIASGLMAGGALGGVAGAALRLFPWYAEEKIKTPFYDNNVIANMVSLIGFTALCVYLWMDSTRKSAQALD
jgi:hypothetical protein